MLLRRISSAVARFGPHPGVGQKVRVAEKSRGEEGAGNEVRR